MEILELYQEEALLWLQRMEVMVVSEDTQQVYGQPSAPGAQYGTNTPLIAGVGQFNDSGFWGGLSSCFALGGSGKALLVRGF